MKCKIKGVPMANNGLAIQNNQYENLSDDTILLKGKSHEKGGTMINYQGNVVEAESGETVSKDQDGNLVIFGNLEVPGTGKKFKNYVKDIAREENKANKLLDKGTELINDKDPYNAYQAFGFNSGRVMADAALQKDQMLSEKKNLLAEMQNSILKMSEASGKSPEKVVSTLKNGGKIIPKMKDGGSVAERHNNPGNMKFAKWMEKYGAVKGQAGTDGGNFANFPSVQAGQQAMIELLKKPLYSGKTVEDAIKTWTGGASYGSIPTEIRSKKVSSLQGDEFTSLLNTITTGEDSKLYNWDGSTTSPFAPHNNYDPRTRRNMIGSENEPIEMQETIISTSRNPRPQESLSRMPLTNEFPNSTEFTPEQVLLPSNTMSNKPQKSNTQPIRNRLGIQDFMGEIAALADRPDYVEGQQYNPIPYTPYQVSFQDQLNRNNSTFRGVAQQLTNNPEALSVLAAQKYDADSNVLGEQFRTNQGIQNQITNQNIQLFNQAELQNIQLRDQQYDRQARAKGVTEDRKQQALTSISNKIGQNRAINKSLRMYENFSSFKGDQNGRLNYAGTDPMDLLNFYGQGNNTTSNDSYQRTVTTKDATGNVRNIREYDPSEVDKNLQFWQLIKERERSSKL